jgi:hypothetical protein
MHLGTERFERLTYFFVMTIMIVSAVYRDKVNMGETLLFLVYHNFKILWVDGQSTNHLWIVCCHMPRR